MNSFRSAVLALCLGLAAAGLAGTPSASAEPPRHRIHLRLDPAGGAIEVSDRIVVSGRKALVLRLAEWLRIGEIRVDGRARAARPSRGVLTLALPSDGRHEVELLAQGVVPEQQAGTAQHGAAAGPLAAPDGVYLPAWADWFPDTGDADISYELTVETPPGVAAVATGGLVSETRNAARNSAGFAASRARQRPSVFAGPYTVSEKTIANVRIRAYFHREVAALADGYIEAAATFLEYFAARIGPYPFAAFRIVSAPLPVGLGFPGLAYIDRRILPLPFIKDRSLAHEVLHNWWGNGVAADDRTGNWAEGLTTYMADHALAAGRDPEEAADMRLGWLRDYAALPASDDAPVTRFLARSHDATQVVGYGKVAFIFHMLRHEIGERAFDDGLKRFWEAHKFGTAGWPDLRKAFEAAAGRDLGWFFDQWTERAGAPRLELTDAVAGAEADGFRLDLALTQSAPPYRLKVPVEVATEAGPVLTDIVSEGTLTTATIGLNAKPVSVRVDPAHTLFRRLLPGEAPPILRDVLLDKEAATLLLYDAPALSALAGELARRLFDATPARTQGAPDGPPGTALLAIGPAARIDTLMARLGVAERPAEIAGKGSARAWTARQADGKAVLFVEAEGQDELRGLFGPLPHYRSKSHVVFEAGRGVESGVWPATGDALTKRFQ
jgi:hypothetical protein